MFDNHKPHPFLAQLPLTVSPFVSIPTAVTLPYTFRSVPASLPPSILANDENGKFVKSASGHAAHPNDIISACQALQEHVSKSAESDKNTIAAWEDTIKEKDLAEKRRVAPGWLDREEKILEPTKLKSRKDEDLLEGQSSDVSAPIILPTREGEELDRAFGTLGMK